MRAAQQVVRRFYVHAVTMDIFGNTDPKKMPSHFFEGALDIDYSTAIRADITAQDFSVAPRHWYIDARFRCADCGSKFVWSASEQKVWFETYRFYVDSQATRCCVCRANRRDAVQLRKEYDALVSDARSHGSAEQKQRVIEILDDLESYWRVLPDKMRETRDAFRRQLTEHNSQ
jgi:putative zinc ribbon protein